MHPEAGRTSASTSTVPVTLEGTARSNTVAVGDRLSSGNVLVTLSAVNWTDRRPETGCAVVS